MFLLSEASARCREACTSKLGERGHLGVDALSTPIAHCVTPCCSFFVATWFLLTNACASCPPPPLPMIHIGCVFFFLFCIRARLALFVALPSLWVPACATSGMDRWRRTTCSPRCSRSTRWPTPSRWRRCSRLAACAFIFSGYLGVFW